MSEPTFSININGLEGVTKAMLSLPIELAKTAFVRACKAAAEPVLRAAKDYVPVRYGFLRNALVSRAKRLKDGLTFVCMIGVQRGQPAIPVDVITRGPNKGEMEMVSPGRYLHLVEKGSSTREATPFLRPAISSEAVNAVDIFETQINREIDTAVLKVTYGGSGTTP